MKPVRQCVTVFLALVVLGAAQPLLRIDSTDPARDLASVRLFVSTRAGAVDVSVANASVASYRSSIVSGREGVRSSQTGQTLRISGNIPGELAEAQFDVILSDVPASGTIGWRVSAERSVETILDVQVSRSPGRPQSIDRFTTDQATATFATDAALLQPGSVRVARPSSRLVLAQFYPWYPNLAAWNDSDLAGRPLRRYSTDDLADVTRLAREARSAGIDAFDMSWQGPSDRRLDTILDAARAAGIKACAFIESWDANRSSLIGQGADVETMTAWIEYLVDRYASHPAYLRVGGRPVILVYTASNLSTAEWTSVIARVHASGRHPLVIGDFYQFPLLEPLDGAYDYLTVWYSGDELLRRNRLESLRVRTYSLLRPGDRRRIWAATVSPGYDDSNVASRTRHTVVPRDGARLYDLMWSTVLDTAADWVIITTWNEWFEHTAIEPGEKDGTLMLDRTRFWTAEFKRRSRAVEPRDPRDSR
jgi:hypothetical protein